MREVNFELNGQKRTVMIRVSASLLCNGVSQSTLLFQDESAATQTTRRLKADTSKPLHVRTVLTSLSLTQSISYRSEPR